MDKLNYDKILNRESISNKIINILEHFNNNKNDLLIKRGIYLYGESGTGKTFFINNLLKKLNYDIIYFDSSDSRNKTILDIITKYNMGSSNILSLFKKEKRNIAIIMDEIDGMNSGDKGGINSLIKLMRAKKTKKQKTEEIANNIIICISNYQVDKKIKELMKISHSFEFKTPTNKEIKEIIKIQIPNLSNNTTLLDLSIKYCNNNLRKINLLSKFYLNNINNLDNFKNIIIIENNKNIDYDTKNITSILINNKYNIEEQSYLLNENDRTIIGLLFHENIIDQLQKIKNKNNSIYIYLKLLNNTCYGDYIDRITFQKQIWQFNEMSSIIKILSNNYEYHNYLENNSIQIDNIKDIRFTKVLTKYSTEYNNSLFLQDLSKFLSMDKKDTISFFKYLRNNYTIEIIEDILELYEINNLEINRIYRYIDKNNKNSISTSDYDLENVFK
jgi:hypothetical protein